MLEPLDAIGLKYGTDKSSRLHNYLTFYESFMAPLRDAPITLLEIGVFEGASLRTWREYFPKAKIIGVDINSACKQFETADIQIELADQSNIEHLTQVALNHGPFDIIIEDGSHFWEHQITTLRTLFPHLRNGGHYVVEDLQTNYGALQDKYKGVASLSCMDYLKQWLDLFVADTMLDINEVEDAFLRTYGRAASFLLFHRRACVIRKKVRQPIWRLSEGAPLIPRPADARKVVLTAHFGLRGDVAGPNGYVDEGSDSFTIQGVMMESDTGALEYRVRSPEGDWSDWTSEGVFVGSRGLARAITGLAVRIAEPAAPRFELQVQGRFVGGVTVDTASGADCVAGKGVELRGAQVVLRPKGGPA